MRWEDLPDTVDRWRDKLASVADAVRTAALGVPTSAPVGYYADPESGGVGLFALLASHADLARCKAAAARVAAVRSPFLSYQELADPDGRWVKVAYSQVLRRAGEVGNFFPGQYAGGISNHPSPVAAMLTSGLLGAGLGWGTGRLLGAVLPDGYGANLGRTGAIAGGLLGAAPGALWAAANHGAGLPLNSPRLLASRADAPAQQLDHALDGTNAVPEAAAPDATAAVGEYLHNFHKDGAAMSGVGGAYRTAVALVKRAFGDTFGAAYTPRDPGPLDVNVNALGQTLWGAGASPGLAGTTMGAMYAAQQLPDPRSRPGWVTPGQLGALAQNAVGDYAKGLLVGAAINAAIGTPFSAPAFGAGAAALGVIGSVIPKLFGG